MKTAKRSNASQLQKNKRIQVSVSKVGGSKKCSKCKKSKKKKKKSKKKKCKLCFLVRNIKNMFELMQLEYPTSTFNKIIL